MKRVAHDQEADVLIPMIVVVVEVEIAPIIVIVEARHVIIVVASTGPERYVQNIAYNTTLRILSGLNLI